LALSLPTSGGRSVGIVHSRTQATECSFRNTTEIFNQKCRYSDRDSKQLPRCYTLKLAHSLDVCSSSKGNYRESVQWWRQGEVVLLAAVGVIVAVCLLWWSCRKRKRFSVGLWRVLSIVRVSATGASCWMCDLCCVKQGPVWFCYSWWRMSHRNSWEATEVIQVSVTSCVTYAIYFFFPCWKEQSFIDFRLRSFKVISAKIAYKNI
jgi:hypothetical protein